MYTALIEATKTEEPNAPRLYNDGSVWSAMGAELLPREEVPATHHRFETMSPEQMRQAECTGVLQPL